MSNFICKVRMPGSYTDSAVKAKQVEPKITKGAEKAMSYVMNLRDPAFPDVSFFDGTMYSKVMDWAQASVKVLLIHESVKKAKEALLVKTDEVSRRECGPHDGGISAHRRRCGAPYARSDVTG